MSEIFIHPGAVDLHDHFREPSELNLSENFESGTKAAADGGYVVTNDMPNTPGRETWTLERVAEKMACIDQGAVVPVGIVGGMQPEADNVDDIAGMSPLVTSFKQYYTKTTGNDRELGPEDFREQTEILHQSDPNKLVMVHAGEDIEGIIGMVAVDIGQPLHFCHMNKPEDVELIREMEKKYGLAISVGLTPHHYIKTSHDSLTEGSFARMKPELVDQDRADKLFRMLIDGQIDLIETDHAPHPYSAKMDAAHSEVACDEDRSECYGVPNIEFTLPMLFYQMKLGRISAERLVEVTSTKPAEVLGIRLSDDTQVEWDLSHIYRITDDDVQSGAGWTPFANKIAVGKVVNMTVAGQQVIRDEVFKTRRNKAVLSGDIV